MFKFSTHSLVNKLSNIRLIHNSSGPLGSVNVNQVLVFLFTPESKTGGNIPLVVYSERQMSSAGAPVPASEISSEEGERSER